MKRGQMAMWILTKFAMLFFIIGLFLIIFVFEQRERDLVCSSQANRIASDIAGRIRQIVDSPVEDEQRSYAFGIGIPLGGSDDSRYFANITYQRHKPSGMQKIIVDVWVPSVGGCNGFATVDFVNKSVRLFPVSNAFLSSANNVNYESSRIALHPSDKEESVRSRYVVAIKCSSKISYPPDKFLFIQDCSQRDPDACISFDGTNEIVCACGFKNEKIENGCP